MKQEIRLEKELADKYEALKDHLKNLESVAVAFSGGIDSALLLKVAHEVLQEKAVAVTAKSCSLPESELAEAVEFCKKEGILQVIWEYDEMEIEAFRSNAKDRCYHCKKNIMTGIWNIARKYNLQYVIEGSNLDDEGDYRPGHRAIQELQIQSPLRSCGFTKENIRQLARILEIQLWNKPSFACLASRFVYGEDITKEKLRMVENGEKLLMYMGFTQFRVRVHGTLARIEVLPEDFERLMKQENREKILIKFKEFGFSYVTMDLKGYRTGSMNEILKEI